MHTSMSHQCDEGLPEIKQRWTCGKTFNEAHKMNDCVYVTWQLVSTWTAGQVHREDFHRNLLLVECYKTTGCRKGGHSSVM